MAHIKPLVNLQCSRMGLVIIPPEVINGHMRIDLGR